MRNSTALPIRLLLIAWLLAIAVINELKRDANAEDSSVSRMKTHPPKDRETRKVINSLKLPEAYEWEEEKSELGKSGLIGDDSKYSIQQRDWISWGNPSSPHSQSLPYSTNCHV